MKIAAAVAFAAALGTAPLAAAVPERPPARVSAPLVAASDAAPIVAAPELGPVRGDLGPRDAAVKQADAAAADYRGNAADLYDAILSGRWFAAVAAALLLGVYTVRRIALRRVAWFQTRLGGWLVNFALASTAAVAVGMRAGSIGLATVLDAIALGVCSAGAYQVVRDVRRPVADRDDVG